MQIYCRQCSAEIQAKDINLDKMIAKCDKCNALFSFADMYEDTEQYKKKREHPNFYEYPMPNNMSMSNSGDALIIERKWFTWSHIFLAAFAVIWNGMIWGIFVPNFTDARMDDGFFSLFLLPFIAVGIGIGYVAIAGFLNTTTIRVDSLALDIRHHPLPFLNKNIPTGDIEQLFTKQKITRNKNSTSVSYELHVVVYGGQFKRLIQGLDNAEQALFIEQEVEKFLGIENVPVSGEYR